jgi:hypothetical protein
VPEDAADVGATALRQLPDLGVHRPGVEDFSKIT